MKFTLSIIIGLAFAACFLIGSTPSEVVFPKKGKTISIGFYNVENLFDLEDDPVKNDNEFTVGGAYGWCKENYQIKLDNLAKAISGIGDEDGPELLGLAEIENRKVVEALIATGDLAKYPYGIVHAESPDNRGIDVGMIYKKDVFTPVQQQSFRVPFPENKDLKTRDILMVKGVFGKKDTLYFFVNHWSSRRGGPDASSYKRERAASVLRGVVDSLQARDPEVRIAIVGDFNDDPINKSLNEVLKAGPEGEQGKTLVNLMYNMEKEKSMGTLMYKREWDVFDQVILSPSLLNVKKKCPVYVSGSAGIHHPEWMEVAEGDWKGAPRRSHIRRQFYPDGFSDHFPVFVHLQIAK